MKFRKLVSFILATCMLMSLVTPALADETEVKSGEYYETSDSTKNYDSTGQSVSQSTNLATEFSIESGGSVGTVNEGDTVTENKSNPNDSTLKNVNDGSDMSNITYGIDNNNGVVKDNTGSINMNNSIVETNNGTIDSNEYYGIVINNNGTINSNDYYVFNNSGTMTKNGSGSYLINNLEDSSKNGKVSENIGFMANNYVNDTDGTLLTNNNGNIINNYGTVTETYTDNSKYTVIGTIENNYGTIKFDGIATGGNQIITNNYGILINAEINSENKIVEKYKQNTTDPDFTTNLYAVTYATNSHLSNNVTILYNQTVKSADDLTSKKPGDYLTNDVFKSDLTFAEWRNSLASDGFNKNYDPNMEINAFDHALWIYPTFNISNNKSYSNNSLVIVHNQGTITTNNTEGTVESNSGIVKNNFGTVTFDKNTIPDTDTEGEYSAGNGTYYTSYVENNYGTLVNATPVYYDKDGNITTNKDDAKTTIYVDAGGSTATNTLYAITYSRLGISDDIFWSNTNFADQYVENNVSHIYDTKTDTSDGFLDGKSSYEIKTIDKNIIDSQDTGYVVDEFLYWVDVLDNNKIYNYDEVSSLSSITKSMWLRPIYKGHVYVPDDPGTGGGGGYTPSTPTKQEENKESQTESETKPAAEAIADITDSIPTNTPVSAADILNNPNIPTETKELLDDILDPTSTGNIIVKEDGTIGVPVSGDLTVDVTVEGPKVSLGTMPKDDIKKTISNDKDKTLSIDVSAFKGIGQIEVNNDSVKNIQDAEAEALKTVMSIGSLSLNKNAISDVSDMLKGRNLILVVEEIDEGILSKQQKEVVEESKEDKNYLAVVDSYILAESEKIKNLGEGKAVIEIKLDSLGYKEQSGKMPVVYEIAQDGTKTKIDYEIIDHIITFEVNELSTYLITIE